MVYVPALQRKVYRLLSSSSTYRLSLPRCTSSPLHFSCACSEASWLRTIRHFSSSDDHNCFIKRHMRDPDGSLSFDDKGASDRIQQHPSEPVPNRPSRSDHQFDQPPPNFREFSRGSRSFTPRSDSPLGDAEKSNIYSQSTAGFRGRNMGVGANKEAPKMDQSFLEKFKLGFDNKRSKPSEDAGSSQFEGEKKSSPDEPAPDSIPQDADEIFKKMKATGLIPNAVAMLDGLCKDGLVQEAMKLFGLMREKGTIPEVVIYTAVVEGYTKAHKADDAIRIFRKMQNNGISPNAFSYTVLIKGLYKCNRSQDAIEFCMEMLEAGHSPNLLTFVGLVDSICKEKGVTEAQGVVRRLMEKGFNLNEKAIREFLDKKAPFSSSVWEAILGKKTPQGPF
ncbi:pentatricopeptide repeat-containing protein At4g38150-like [Neltuma alba]|uniref:pentatricopeptide repeat-containing protein At4g38150-like n=1 Tax=Neltuma alba TaxID=207710 RepID=UPI0010A4B963|nr:pentatricopeptide repeat-containing protein At4g38150-like [Prosopis alba]XP_028801937.1 pentatricopeptide repeat-containing protein At4g38150-like [Prosopis alba]XP_028801946.1 pentatricopeptide repeat-containing protein At4g38150-like [Prosopis alba]